MEMPRAVLFDLDDTLAASFEAPKKPMVERLSLLLDHAPIAIITGREFSRVEPDFLPLLVPHALPDRFFVLAESSADSYAWDGAAWRSVVRVDLTDEERARIGDALAAALAKTRVLEGVQTFGTQMVNKRGLVAFSMLGVDVPADMRYTWDPQHERRRALQADLAVRLPEYDVFLGGATTIDITKHGVNKAAGVHWLAKRLDIEPAHMLYIGDALYPGGNDAVVKETGAMTRDTSGPDETLTIIDELLSGFEIARSRTDT